MILTDLMIQMLVEDHELIKPYEENNQQPASYDLRVSNIRTEDDREVWTVNPGETVLIGTLECVSLPDNIVGFIKDKSTYLRALCSVGQGFVDPGFNGNLTVQFTNHSKRSIAFNPGMPFCQIVFAQTGESVGAEYNGHYQNADGILTATPNVLGIGGGM